MTSVAERLRPGTPTRRWVGLVAAAAIWVVLYQANEPFWTWLIADVAGMDLTGRAGSAVLFFCADTVKIALLLIGIIFIVTVLRSFMSLERTRAMLGGKREGVGNVMAASLGVVTPFCSCSAVPAFIGFVAAGIPIGVTMGTQLAFMMSVVALSLPEMILLRRVLKPQLNASFVGVGVVGIVVVGYLFNIVLAN